MSKKLTPWFVDGQLPAYPGVYEVEPSNWAGWLQAFQYWDGDKWHFRRPSADEAFESRRHYTTYARPKWRGLAEKP